jgi:hypothetical protein
MRIALKCHQSQFNYDIVYLGKSFFGRFSSKYTSNTRVCRSKLLSDWRPCVIFLLQTFVCQDCSKKFSLIYLSQKWRTNYLLHYRGCLNVHEKNMEIMFLTKKLIIFIIIINGNTM